METISIPRVSTLTKDREIFSNLAKFSAVTGYVPSSTQSVLSSVDTYHMKPENKLTSFLRNLRNSVLKKSRADYEMIGNDEFKYTLFSSETCNELRERKKTLVQLAKKHEAAMLTLREARMVCWKSQDKIEKYKLILETQRSALKYNQDEAKIRTAAIKDMETMLNKWIVVHEKDHIQFEEKFLEEIKYREKIQKISNHMEAEIIEMLEDTIQTMMNRNKQHIRGSAIKKLAHQLYSQTSRTYKFNQAQNIPCQKVWIEKPAYENSTMCQDHIKRKIKQVDQNVKRMEKN